MWRAVRPLCRTAPLCQLFRSAGAAQQQGARWVLVTVPCCWPARLCAERGGAAVPVLLCQCCCAAAARGWRGAGYCVCVPSVTACSFFPLPFLHSSSPVLWDESGSRGSLVAVRRGSCCCDLYQQATFKHLCNVSMSPGCCQSSCPTLLSAGVLRSAAVSPHRITTPCCCASRVLQAFVPAHERA